MDWMAFYLSLKLAACTMIILLFVGLLIARFLAWRQFRGKAFVEAMVALPLVLPPTVLGFYLLSFMGKGSWLGGFYESVTGNTLVFSFAGLLIASLIYSLPFAVQPMLRAFEAIPKKLREAAWCSGLDRWKTFFKIELPLAWPGILSGMVLAFAHTLGEFGVVLMLGGNIPGETRTISIAIFDQVQSFNDESAKIMSLVLLIFAFATISLVFLLNKRRPS
ncbi:MAG: molybdate ABC transporter permease subunit [Gammaproteobacteria bacterium]